MRPEELEQGLAAFRDVIPRGWWNLYRGAIAAGFNVALTLGYRTMVDKMAKVELVNPFTGQGILVNAFCPTGKGGGVDPTCGKGVKKSGSYESLMSDWMDSAEPLYKDAWSKGKRTSQKNVRVLSEKQVRSLLDKHGGSVKGGWPLISGVDRGEFGAGGAFSRGFGLRKLSGSRGQYTIIKILAPI